MCSLSCSTDVLQHDPYPQQLPLLRGRGAEPSLKHRALFRLQPNLGCVGDHLDVGSGGFCEVANDKFAACCARSAENTRHLELGTRHAEPR